jgi:hypothetical protein
VNYPQSVIRNVASAATWHTRVSAMIEQIFECGGLPELARERYLREAALAARAPHKP